MIRRPWAIVAFLSALNLVNYVDRFIVAAVGPRLKQELGLSDLRFGLVLNAFMVGYFLTSPVFGALGDRGSRKKLIAVGVAVWSIATATSGLARSFLGIVLARCLVGIGEASYATIAPTIIDDLADPAKKNSKLAVFYVAIPIGSALGYVLGGALEHAFGWRAAFFVAGGPGVLLALLMLLVSEPPRLSQLQGSAGTFRVDDAKASEERAGEAEQRTDAAGSQAFGVLATWPRLLRISRYRDAVIGYTAYTFALGGFAGWAPHYLCHELHMDLHVADFWFGVVLVVTGLFATFIGGELADRWPGQDRVRANLRFCAVTAALSVPFAVLCLMTRSETLFFVAIGLAEFALFLSTSPINVVILQAVPAPLRASAMALSIFAIHLLGDMVSPPLIGAISDAASLRTGMFLLPIALVLATLAWWMGSSINRRDTV